MLAFKDLVPGEIFIMNDNYHMKVSNSIGNMYGVNLETKILEEIDQDEPVVPTDCNIENCYL